MDGDGKNVCRLTKTRANDFSPRWSPDGRTIAFVSNRNGLPRIFLMKRGSDMALPLKNTDPPSDVAVVSAPLDWSPDGKEIAFVGAGHTAVRIVNVQTGEVRTLFRGAVGDGYAHHCGISWNKADGTILFNSHDPGSAFHQDIFRVDPNSGGITQVTDGRGKPWHSTAPASSPDGRKVAVARHANLELQPPGPIFLMNSDGTGLAPLPSTGDTRNAIPRWSPDGKHLVYCDWHDKGFHHIRILALDGGTPIPLTSGEWNDIQPDICLGPAPAPEAEADR
jgi:Tol biopolymer transport system component